jgi:proline racemase
VSAKDIRVRVEQRNISELRRIGTMIRKRVCEQVPVEHPEKPDINQIMHIRIIDDPTKPEAQHKNIVITGEGQFDRSPCGTGTCAHMATLYSKGELKLNEESVHESIIGTIFKGKLINTTKVGNYNAVITEITGSAYITGISTCIIDPNDPLKHGFLIT